MARDKSPCTGLSRALERSARPPADGMVSGLSILRMLTVKVRKTDYCKSSTLCGYDYFHPSCSESGRVSPRREPVAEHRPRHRPHVPVDLRNCSRIDRHRIRVFEL